MAKVSIIVPIFKVEAYLDRCVQSLIEQSLKDIEIILVDDGSPDNCPVMCDELAKSDCRIKVVHKKNGGLSSARNAGMAIATGKYVGFVDSDDDVDLRMFEILYQIAEQENVDFVMSDYIRIFQNGESYLKTLDIDGGRYDKQKIKKEIFPRLIMGEKLEYGPLLSVWHCLYRREFLLQNDLKFDEDVRWSEDNIFSAIAGYYADSFYYLKGEGLYHYYQNPGTITTAYRPSAWNVYCVMNQHLREVFDDVKDFDFQKQLKLHMIFYACNCLGQIKLSGKSFREKMAIRREIMNSVELKEAFNDFQFPEWSWKLKIQVGLIKYRMKYLYQLLIG